MWLPPSEVIPRDYSRGSWVCSLIQGRDQWESLSVILRVSALYREFTLNVAFLYDSIQSRDKLVMTAGFHFLGADGEVMIQTGFGYETKPRRELSSDFLVERAEEGI